ncbi:MAG: DUF2842 domain-containing protein [Parvularculaceae bacterium]|nr:DUF2842 domain-containing protein [Parvularculaceae bacterium]
MKKLIGLAVLAPALIVYFGVVVTLADHLPDNAALKLVYFIVTGLAWAAPTIPFIRWMEREPR